ncbi:MAG: YdaS family helix-turn-helix protein [Pseudomonadota bacterium]
MIRTKVNAVKQAIHTLGGPTKASNALGVSNATIHSWLNKGNVPNIDLAIELAMLSGLKVEDLRPMVENRRPSWL